MKSFIRSILYILVGLVAFPVLIVLGPFVLFYRIGELIEYEVGKKNKGQRPNQ